MAKKGRKARKTSPRGTRGQEWVGGILGMPAYVTGEGPPYRPEVLVWLSGEGLVMGAWVGRPGEALDRAAESLQEAIDAPMAPSGGAPRRIRVDSPELAEAVRETHRALDVVVGPVPELDAVAQSMFAHLQEAGDDEGTSYLLGQSEPEACATFFAAAADLYRAAPWRKVPDEMDLFGLDAEALGLRGAVLCVIGQMGESRGFLLFDCLDDHHAFASYEARVLGGDDPTLPAHLTLNYDRLDDIPPALRREFEVHRWKVAGKEAYPWPVLMDEDMVARPPDPRELRLLLALCRALPLVLEDEEPLAAAWNGRTPYARTVSVETPEGEVALTFHVPPKG